MLPGLGEHVAPRWAIKGLPAAQLQLVQPISIQKHTTLLGGVRLSYLQKYANPPPEQCRCVSEASLPVVAVNDAFELAPAADVVYAADCAWWLHHAQRALKAPGIKVTASDSTPFQAVKVLRNTGVEGFDPDPSCLRTGGNGGYQAIHLAIHAGAARILLLGFDMRGSHFFGRHPAPLRNTDPGSFVTWAGRFGALNDRGAEIVNCTPGSALRAFPVADLEAEIA